MTISLLESVEQGLPPLSEVRNSEPGTYVRFHDDTPYPDDPSRSVGGFVVETRRGMFGRTKVRSNAQLSRLYGHDPVFSNSIIGPRNHLTYSNSAQIVRATGGATAPAAVLATIPADDDAPDDLVGRIMLLPVIVGEQAQPDAISLSDDMAIGFVSKHPGQMPVNIKLVPEMESPLGGFWVFVDSALGAESYHVSLTHRTNGYNRQMYVEDVINRASESIVVVVNTNYSGELIDELVDREMRVRLGGGFAGDRVTDIDVLDCLREFIDTDACLLDTLVQNGWITPSISRTMTKIAEYRQDTHVILDVPYSCINTRDDNERVERLQEYRRDKLRIDSSYASLYADWFEVTDISTQMKLAVPPSMVVCGVYAFVDSQYHAHYAPAGKSRADLARFGVNRIINGALPHEFRNPLSQAQINATRSIDEDGIYLWNDRTLQRLESSLTFIGTARMRNALKKRMTAIGEQYQFDPQNQDYRTAIENAVSDMFEKEKRAGSMSTFRKEWSPDNTAREGAAGRAYLRIFYSPVGSNRQLMIDCTLTRTDVSVFAAFIK